MSEKPNIVSIFCGKFPNEQAFSDYITFDYSLDDDMPPSQFMADFGIDWYDEDFTEASFIENGLLSEQIHLHSYAETFDKKAFSDSKKFNDNNSLYLIYDFDATNYQLKNTKLTLIGVYTYEKHY